MLKTQKEKAEAFRSMHLNSGKILVLPNAWDVASARMFEKSGFLAVATSSAGALVSLGFEDGDKQGFSDYIDEVERIGSHLSVPYSVDILAGMAHNTKDLEKTVREIVKAGAVGLNIEDFDHFSKKLVPPEDQIRKLKTIRETSDSLGVPLVINARTDALRYAKGDEESKFRDAVSRGLEYIDAGADCVYPMGLLEREKIASFVEALDHFPVNVMIRKGLPSLKELEIMDVRRVSFGPYASYAAMGLLKRISDDILRLGKFDSLVEGAITFDELNDLVK